MHKQIEQIDHELFKIPTGGRQTSWLFKRRSGGVELGATEKQTQLSGRAENLNLGPPDFKSSALNHSATQPPQGSQKYIHCFSAVSVNNYTALIWFHSNLRVRPLKMPKRFYWCASVLWRKIGFSTYSCLEAVSSVSCIKINHGLYFLTQVRFSIGRENVTCHISNLSGAQTRKPCPLHHYFSYTTDIGCTPQYIMPKLSKLKLLSHRPHPSINKTWVTLFFAVLFIIVKKST